MAESLVNSIGVILTIASVGAAVTVFAFGWIIRILMRQNKDRIVTIESISELDKLSAVHSETIKNMKEKEKSMENKIEDLSVTIGTLNVTVQENGVVVRALKNEVDKYEKKLTSMDLKLDQIVLALAGR